MATYKGVQWVEGYPDPSTFDPGVDTVDTDAWADAAVSAGMKYGVLTVKHVAGFCLWDSQYTTYDVMHPDCPYQKDLVAQFIESFKSRGLKVGLYYCWRHPGFDKGKNKGKFKVLPPECDPATHTLQEQNEFQKAQIAELLTKYPDVFYIWNDGLDPVIMPADEILAHIKSVRPNVLASSNWWDWGKKGTPYADIAVKELRHFPETNEAPGETCWKLEQGWFWNEGARAGSAKGRRKAGIPTFCSTSVRIATGISLNPVARRWPKSESCWLDEDACQCRFPRPGCLLQVTINLVETADEHAIQGRFLVHRGSVGAFFTAGRQGRPRSSHPHPHRAGEMDCRKRGGGVLEADAGCARARRQPFACRTERAVSDRTRRCRFFASPLSWRMRRSRPRRWRSVAWGISNCRLMARKSATIFSTRPGPTMRRRVTTFALTLAAI